MIEFHRLFCKIAAKTGHCLSSQSELCQECWRISVLQNSRQWNSFFGLLFIFLCVFIRKVYSFSNKTFYSSKCSNNICSASGFHNPPCLLHESASFVNTGSFSPNFLKSSIAVSGRSICG